MFLLIKKTIKRLRYQILTFPSNFEIAINCNNTPHVKTMSIGNATYKNVFILPKTNNNVLIIEKDMKRNESFEHRNNNVEVVIHFRFL